MKTVSIEEIKKVADSVAEKLGYKVYDVVFKQGKNPTLTVILDKDGGIDLDDCEKFSNAIEGELDALDPTFGEPYTFNVSSKGIDWAFRTEEDFVSHIGKKVEVKLKNSIKGKKSFDGELLAYDKNNFVIKVDAKTTLSIDLKNLVKMNEYIDFD